MTQTFKYTAVTPYGTITRKSHRDYTHVVACIYSEASPGNQIGDVSFCGSATLAQKKAAAMNNGRYGQKASWGAEVFPLIRS